jgi:hypothetical protein
LFLPTKEVLVKPKRLLLLFTGFVLVSMLLVATLSVATPASVAAPAAPQGGGFQPSWFCPDNGSTTINANVLAATRYTVSIGSNSDDNSVVVIVQNSAGQQVSETSLSGPAGTSVDADVPVGGSISVRDPTDTGNTDGSGGYSSVPI